MILHRPRWWVALAGCFIVCILIVCIIAPAASAASLTNQEFVVPAVPPPFPQQASPVAIFRQLLAMTPDEQKSFLADRAPENQRRIIAKLHEYEALKPNARELKLRATELQWYLAPLLEIPATNRLAQLQIVPADLRNLVDDRLREWDRLSPDAQKDLLDNEATLRYFSQVEPVTAEQQNAVLAGLNPARRAKLEAGIAHWRALPLTQRQKTLDRFNKFFDLTPGEQQRALAKVTDDDRRQMEKTLRRFDQLSPAQRQQCLQAFSRFASLSLADRQQFLKNAERWEMMSPAERQAWRELVQKLAVATPPLPPSRIPPLPPGTSSIATSDRK